MRALRHVGFLATDGAGSHGQKSLVEEHKDEIIRAWQEHFGH